MFDLRGLGRSICGYPDADIVARSRKKLGWGVVSRGSPVV